MRNVVDYGMLLILICGMVISISIGEYVLMGFLAMAVAYIIFNITQKFTVLHREERWEAFLEKYDLKYMWNEFLKDNNYGESKKD